MNEGFFEPKGMAKKQEKQKSIKDQKKELEEKAFGLKNKKQKAAILKQMEGLNLKEQQEKKEKMRKEEMKNIPVKQLIPVGVDPKTIQCVNFLNKICPDGESCKFAHEVVKRIEKQKEETPSGPKRVCQFLIDSLNSGEYTDGWTCPFPKCTDIHRLVDIKDDSQVELSLEEYIELSRQSLPEKLTPLTEETFKEWKIRKQREEMEHARKVKAISTGMKGVELFEERRELFKDDEEAEEIDYKERCYESDSDEVIQV